jgi:transposase
MGLCHVSIRNSLAERALRMVEESLPEHETEFAAMKKAATKLGISPEAIRRWKRQSEVDSGLRPGLSAQEHDEIRRLRRENAELRRANEILKSASAFFASRVSMRPTTK